jgi:8-oxo-dGTP pyrophosphatase MutT (NUDIX family)
MRFVACDVKHILQNRKGEHRIIIEKSCGAVVFTKENNDLNYIIIRSLESFCGFPKGHVEGTESDIQTALREVKEETGLSVDIVDGFRVEDSHPFHRDGEIRMKHIVYINARSGTHALRLVFFLNFQIEIWT